ncbi:MAG: flagellar biosynthesis anti-sigma factor FlgM [Ketobacter sp.]
MAMDINGLNSSQANSSKARNGQKVVSSPVSQPDESNNPAKPSGETVRISAEGQTLNRISKDIDLETPVNQSRVEALRAAIADGSYKVDAQATAAKMLESDSLF